MPKTAIRVYMQIIHIRIGRIQEITAEEAIREGVEYEETEAAGGGNVRLYKNYSPISLRYEYKDPRDSFRSLWHTLYGRKSWDRNEWVFVIHFKRVAQA